MPPPPVEAPPPMPGDDAFGQLAAAGVPGAPCGVPLPCGYQEPPPPPAGLPPGFPPAGFPPGFPPGFPGPMDLDILLPGAEAPIAVMAPPLGPPPWRKPPQESSMAPPPKLPPWRVPSGEPAASDAGRAPQVCGASAAPAGALAKSSSLLAPESPSSLGREPVVANLGPLAAAPMPQVPESLSRLQQDAQAAPVGAFAKSSSPHAPDPLSRLERDPLAQLQDLSGGSSSSSSQPTKKRKVEASRVEGLARGQNIKNGGAVTVYAGYTAVTATAQQQQQQQQTDAATPVASHSATAVSEALPRQLPAGWEMRKSRSTGKVYYVNEKLGLSQFDPPAGSTVKAGRQKKQRPSYSKQEQSATAGDRNGMLGLRRATEKKSGTWAKWQATSAALNDD